MWLVVYMNGTFISSTYVTTVAYEVAKHIHKPEFKWRKTIDARKKSIIESHSKAIVKYVASWSIGIAYQIDVRLYCILSNRQVHVCLFIHITFVAINDPW